MSKTTTRTILETTTEKYEHSDFDSILRVTNTRVEYLPDGSEKRYSSREVRPEPNCHRAEYCRALVLANARYGTLMELPYTTSGISDSVFGDCDAALWYYALTDENPPGKVSFKRLKETYPQFRDAIMAIDFRVYNEDKASEIRQQFSKNQSTIAKQVDAQEIIESELFGDES